MSSLSRYVARITVRSIAAAMRDHGGGKQELIRLRPLARYGLRLIHFREGRIVPRTTTPRPRCRRVSIRTGGVYGPGTQTANPSELKTLQNMTSLRQIEANRRKAIKSTGPRTMKALHAKAKIKLTVSPHKDGTGCCRRGLPAVRDQFSFARQPCRHAKLAAMTTTRRSKSH
jgi:hypothetical protein